MSWLRSGQWINKHCPERNGPCDVDHSFSTHELDNWGAKRKARIEYKREGERVPRGQDLHIRAELESTRSDWKNLFVLVIDEGQDAPANAVKFYWRISGQNFESFAELQQRMDSADGLGRRIAAWLWPEFPTA